MSDLVRDCEALSGWWFGRVDANNRARIRPVQHPGDSAPERLARDRGAESLDDLVDGNWRRVDA